MGLKQTLTGLQMKKLLIIIIISILNLTSIYGQSWDLFTTENSDLPVNNIDNLVIDSNDNLWIYTKNSIFMYDQSQDSWHEFNQSNSNLTDGFTYISIGKDGSIYVSSNHIFEFKENVMNFEIVEENIECTKFVFDKTDKLYFGNRFNVFVREDGKNIEIYNGQVGGPNYHTDLIVDENNILWFSVDGFTSALYNYDGNELDTLDSIFKENFRLSIKSIDVDNKGVIWLGNGDASIILNFNSLTNKWNYFDKSNSPLGEDWMYSKGLTTDNHNNLWVLSARDIVFPPLNLLKYNGSEWINHSIDKAFKIEGQNQLTLLTLTVDSKNNVWIGTNKGLIKFNETTTSVESIEKDIVSIYPNPANNQLTIDLQGKQAISRTISDIKGNIVENRKDNFSGQLNIDLKSYPIGTYIIELTLTNNQKITNKFVKE